jgi:hypothetical protein
MGVSTGVGELYGLAQWIAVLEVAGLFVGHPRVRGYERRDRDPEGEDVITIVVPDR